MGRSKATGWVVGAVLLAVVVIAAAWFLAISPVFAKASEARVAAEDVRQSNEMLRTKITKLRAQYEHLDEYKADLADLRTYVPTQAQLSDYLRALSDKATAHGVTLVQVGVSDPETYQPYTATPAQPAATTDDSATTDSTGSSDASTATASPSATAESSDGTASSDGTTAATTTAEGSAPDGMADIPLQIMAQGSYDNILAFLDAAQQEPGRFLLITSVSATAMPATPASGGRPEAQVGDLEANVSAYLFALPSGDGSATTTDESTSPAQPPAAVPGKVPTIPLAS